MPELPEVETTRKGIAPYVLAEAVNTVIIREPCLRWPVPANLGNLLEGQVIHKVTRRGKYIVFHTERGYMLLHLGMSGSLRILTEEQPPAKHDHVDIIFTSGTCLRYHDPRRFGSIHWTGSNPDEHSLLKHLGPEPLSEEFNCDYLFNKSRKRTQSVKTFIMDSRMVVGIGNIYASESLFIAGINPKRKAGNISRVRYEKLVNAIKQVLQLALASGGTTLRDFVDSSGEPGYFRHELQVYGRNGLPCYHCKTPISLKRIGQRSSFYCSKCQR